MQSCKEATGGIRLLNCGRTEAKRYSGGLVVEFRSWNLGDLK